jgi:hypothetical protein
MTDEKKLKESEDKLHADCFTWFHNTYPHLRGLMWHVPNQLVGLVNVVAANKCVAMGVVKGVPDLEFHFRKRSYFIEMKNPQKTGVVSKDQKEVHKALELQGFIIYIVDNYEAFKALIEMIIGDTSEQFTLGLTKADYYYKSKVFDMLYSLSDCEIVKIKDITELDSRTKFVNFVSEFMVEGYDKLDNFELLFTPDYKGFYRRNNGSNEIIIYDAL